MKHRPRSQTFSWTLPLVLCSLQGCGDYAPANDDTGQALGAPGPSAVEPAPSASATPSQPTPAGSVPPPAPAAAVSCDSAATPCGGDLAGSWVVKDCPLALTGVVDMAGFGLGCTTATITSGSIAVTGSWTADPSGMFTDATVTTGTQEVEMPPECLTVSGTVTSCERVGGPVQSSLGYATFSCVDNAATGGCTCSATIDQEGGLGLVSLQAETDGAYTAMGSTLTVEEDTAYSYCVTENAMVVSFPTPGKIGTLSGPIVLEKQ